MPFCLAVSSVKYNSTNNSIEFGNSGSMPGRNRNSGEPCDEKNYYSPPPLRDRVPHLLSRLSISRSTPVAREHLPPSINQTQRKNRRAASFKNEKVINAKGGRALRGELRNHRAAIVDECVRVCKRERERERRGGVTRSGIPKTLHSTQKPPVTGSGPGPGLDCPKISPPIKRIHCVPPVVAHVRLQCNTVTNSTRWYSLIIGFVSLLYTIPPVQPAVSKPRLALRRRVRKIFRGKRA